MRITERTNNRYSAATTFQNIIAKGLKINDYVMEVENIIESVINNDKSSSKNNESVDEQKSKLKEQIKKLKSLILQMEWSLDMLKFGKTKCIVHPNTTTNPNADEIPDVTMQLESNLYRYSGFYCTKFTKHEYVFNFSSLNKYDNENTYAIQILNNQDKGTLGKWIMPMAIDLNDLVSEIPITELKNVPRFLRICKHYIDCYSIRSEQYIKLENIISQIKNCNIQTNLGYTQIMLNLRGVYDKNNDTYMNIIIYLLYNIGEARPHKIEVDSATKNELDKKTKKQLETCLGHFKKVDLCVAFEKILNEEKFMWSKEDDEDSPLEINDLSESDETGYLESFSLHGKSLTLGQSRTEMRRKKTRKRKRSSHTNTSKHNEESISHRHKRRSIQNTASHSAKQQSAAVIESTSGISDLKQNKLKRTKLQFQLSNSELRNSSETMSSEKTIIKSKKGNERQNNPFTSTPIYHNKHTHNMAASSNINISDITTSDNNLNSNINKGNIDTPKHDRLKGGQGKSSTSVKQLPQKVKKKAKSGRSKSQTTKENVLRKKAMNKKP